MFTDRDSLLVGEGQRGRMNPHYVDGAARLVEQSHVYIYHLTDCCYMYIHFFTQSPTHRENNLQSVLFFNLIFFFNQINNRIHFG